MSDQNEDSGFLRRRRSKVIAFIITEALAIGVLLLSGTFALSSRLADSTLAMSVNIVTIGAAAAAAMIPIIFFAISPILPRRDWSLAFDATQAYKASKTDWSNVGFTLISRAERSPALFRRLLLPLREREALRLLAARPAFLNVISALAVSHKF
jgi:hypothetical protein